jgi:NAD(P)-dependent dehydrogenase (short-subunit alcohol dehydrogenase family)
VSAESIAGELAVQLSKANPSLIVLSARSQSRVGPIVEEIKTSKPNVGTRFLEMDLGDLSDIRRAIGSLDDVPKIDHFVAVAGLMAPPYNKTVNGVESQFGVNFLANFLLVKLLLPKILAAGPSSSIIIVASSAARQGVVNFDDINSSVSNHSAPFSLELQDRWSDRPHERMGKRIILLSRIASLMLLEPSSQRPWLKNSTTRRLESIALTPVVCHSIIIEITSRFEILTHPAWI